jgi:riboflavin synthase
MFTGLIQAVGKLESRQALGGDLRLRFSFGNRGQSKFSEGKLYSDPFSDMELGESIAVSGVCLTVVDFDAATFSADVSNETLALTTLGDLEAGAAVNLERSLLPNTRLGGHLVAGHVDGLGRVAEIRDDGRSQRWRFTAPRPLLRYIATKGSVAVDGVSLTVNDVDDAGFEVNLIPHTVAHTAFAAKRVGDAANIEVDTIARYVERLAVTKDWT